MKFLMLNFEVDELPKEWELQSLYRRSEIGVNFWKDGRPVGGRIFFQDARLTGKCEFCGEKLI